MKDLNHYPSKSSFEARGNNKLHDLAETCGKNLLIQWGFKFEPIGENKQYKKIWDERDDRPDGIIEYKGKKAFVYWKGRRHPVWLVNKQAVSACEKGKEDLQFPVIICFAVFDRHYYFLDFRFAVLGVHLFTESEKKDLEYDKVVEFVIDLPEFKKADILRYLL